MICGKVLFDNIKSARAHGKGPCVYWCKECEAYHTSNMTRKAYKQMVERHKGANKKRLII